MTLQSKTTLSGTEEQPSQRRLESCGQQDGSRASLTCNYNQTSHITQRQYGRPSHYHHTSNLNTSYQTQWKTDLRKQEQSYLKRELFRSRRRVIGRSLKGCNGWMHLPTIPEQLRQYTSSGQVKCKSINRECYQKLKPMACQQHTNLIKHCADNWNKIETKHYSHHSQNWKQDTCTVAGCYNCPADNNHNNKQTFALHSTINQVANAPSASTCTSVRDAGQQNMVHTDAKVHIIHKTYPNRTIRQVM